MWPIVRSTAQIKRCWNHGKDERSSSRCVIFFCSLFFVQTTQTNARKISPFLVRACASLIRRNVECFCSIEFVNQIYHRVFRIFVVVVGLVTFCRLNEKWPRVNKKFWWDSRLTNVFVRTHTQRGRKEDSNFRTFDFQHVHKNDQNIRYTLK